MKNKIAIVGAGISGLISAIELHKNQCSIDIYEKSVDIGGRTKTDQIEDYCYDHGFQALLTAYPYVKKYLDLDKLEIQKFLPGAEIIFQGKKHIIGDPTRNISFIKSALDNKIATIGDKIKTLRLSNELKNKSVAAIFDSEEIPTHTYLQEYGFSERIIKRFFVPFFGGIYLEKKLSTSSRLFEFVFKMFAEGYSSIPKLGIQSIAYQLKTKLSHVNFFLGQSINHVESGLVTLSDGSQKEYDHIIIANGAHNYTRSNPITWKSCVNLYYEVQSDLKSQKMISLIGDENKLINNFHFPTDLHPHPKGKRILSVTVVEDQGLKDDKLIKSVQSELDDLGIVQKSKLIKYFKIDRALPQLNSLQYVPKDEDLILDHNVYTTGDHLAMGSLNAAMASGAKVAELINQKI